MKTRHTHAHGAENEESEHQLYEAIVALRNPEEAKKFFEDLCTPTERLAMADRWRVVEPIQQGIPYRSIAEDTGVSVTTIGRVARCLMLGQGGYNLIYTRIKRKNHVKFKIKNSIAKKRSLE
ncbi:MAG: YerC/YecD family TrpR-related protein [Candidatus Berkiella sp.]|jgi:TrpR-related protein YerC/YecD